MAEQAIVSASQPGETGLTAAQVKVLSETILKGLSPSDMGLVFHQAKQFGLDVFRKEIWAYKDHKGNLVTITGRDGLLKVAARNPNFGGLRSGAVYAKDAVEIDLGAGTVKHVPALTGRGELLGAWAAAYRAGFPPIVMYAEKAAVHRDTPIWKAKPAEMCLARVESMVLRRADVGVGSLYLEDEMEESHEDRRAAVDISAVESQAEAAVKEVAKRRKAAKEETKEAKVEAVTAPQSYDVDTPEGYLRMQWEHPGLPKHVLEARKVAGSLESYCARLLELGTESVILSSLSPEKMEKCLLAVMDRNDTFDLDPHAAKEEAAPEAPAVILAAPEKVAELSRALGGETWLKKAMLRKFGHDNAYALTDEGADALLADIRASSAAKIAPFEDTLKAVASQELKDGAKAKPSVADRIKAEWLSPKLPEITLAQRKTEGSLRAFCSAKAGRELSALSDLTPTEAEDILSAVIARNSAA